MLWKALSSRSTAFTLDGSPPSYPSPLHGGGGGLCFPVGVGTSGWGEAGPSTCHLAASSNPFGKRPRPHRGGDSKRSGPPHISAHECLPHLCVSVCHCPPPPVPRMADSLGNADKSGAPRRTITPSSDFAPIWVSQRIRRCPCVAHMGLHAHSYKRFHRPQTLKTATRPLRAPPARFPKTGASYPYLFVFPLYRFLKVGNLPDITRLFLL